MVYLVILLNFIVVLLSWRLRTVKRSTVRSDLREISQDDEHDVMESVPHLVCIHYLQNDQMIFNHRWTEYAGAEPKAEGFWDKVVHSEDWARIQAFYVEAWKIQNPFEFEYRILRHDGSWRWHLVRGEFIRNPAGVVTKCVSTSTDIHEQKNAEGEKARLLQEVEAKTNLLSTVIDQMPMGVVVAGPDRKIISQNKRMAQFFQLGSEHTVGKLVGYKPDGSIVQEDEWVIVRALKTGATEKMEFRTRDEERGERIFHSLASPILNAQGDIVGGVSIVEEITEYRRQAHERTQVEASMQAAKEVKKSQKFLESLVDNIPHLIVMKDAKTLKYTMANRACTAYFADDSRNLVGKTSHEIYPKEIADGIEANDLAAISSNSVIEIPRHVLYKEGYGPRVFQTKKFVVEGDDGEKVLIGISTDITDMVEAEKKSIVAKDQAELVAKMKSEFLANMSHEIRTPLNGVIGMTDLILDGALDRQQKKFVEMVRESGNALLSIVNDILDFSKVESGLVELENIDFEVRTTFASHLEMLRMRAKSKEIALSYEFDADVPAFLQGDPNRITQVLNNLIGNAIKFTDEGGKIDIRAHINLVSMDESILSFSVIDTGIGLTEEELAKLFKPFVQGDGSMARKYGGTGLGLSICKRLVQLMKGDISVESKKGSGSTFTFTMRLKNSRVSPKTSLTFTEITEVNFLPSIEFNGKHVLLVEDNEINRMLVLTLLKRLGYTADIAVNGHEAVAAAQKVNYDLILMDCQMPELDGFEATRRIRDLERGTYRHVPVIALTANARAEDRERCLSAGMDDFISKPIKRESLTKILKNWMFEKVSI